MITELDRKRLDEKIQVTYRITYISILDYIQWLFNEAIDKHTGLGGERDMT